MTVLRASLAALLMLQAFGAVEAAPRIDDIQPRGLQPGKTNTLTIAGSGFSSQARVIADFAVERIEVVQNQGNRLRLRIVPAAGATAGYYVLRVSTPQGTSNPAVVAVDGLRQIRLASVSPLKLEADQLPAAVSGRIRGAQVQQVTFPGKAGQQVVVEVEAQRLGSSLRPAVEVLDPQGVPLGYSQWMPLLQGDARVVITLPGDGNYTVKLHDVLYRGGGFYRLKIGQFVYADGTFPLVVQRGRKSTVGLVWSNAQPRTQFAVSSRDPAEMVPLPWQSSSRQMFSAPAPALRLADVPQASEPVESKQPLAAPVGVSGVLSAPGEVDRFRVRVSGGRKYRVEVLARRAGSPLDSLLVVRTGKGKVLGQNNDQRRTLDSRLDVTVPKDVTELEIVVRDQLGRGGEQYAYHVSVLPLPVARVQARLDRAVLNVPAQGIQVFRLTLQREGYGGPVHVKPEGSLPDGVSLLNAVVPAGASQALLAVRSEASSAGQPALVRLLLQDDQGRVLGVARGTEPQVPAAPWLAARVPVQSIAAAPLAIAWKRDSLPPHLQRGTAARLVVRIRRPANPSGPVRLRLITSQKVPTVRQGNSNKPDVQKALRLESPVEIPPGEESVEQAVSVLVPATLPRLAYDLALRAELLSPDKKRVVAVAATEPLRLEVARQAVSLQVAQKTVQPQSAHRPVLLAGKVVREGGFRGPVVVRVTGLPSGALPAESAVLPGEEQFRLPVRVSSAWAGKTLKLRITAQGVRPGEPPVPALKPEEVTLKIPAKLPAGPLRCVLEDDLGPVQYLAQKHKQPLRPDVVDAYAGSCSLELVSGKAVLSALPWLAAPVSEKPQGDQVRYLRWAWRAPFASQVTLRVRGIRSQGEKKAPVELAWTAGGKQGQLPLPREWTLVTQDLFAAAKGAFELQAVELEADRGPVWLDSVYLAAGEEDFRLCPPPRPGPHLLRLAEDEPEIASRMTDGRSDTRLETKDVFTGLSAYRAGPPRSLGRRLFGAGIPIREKPQAGQYRYICFAWKAIGGDQIYLEVGHEEKFGPRPGNDKVTFRYRAGPGSYLAALSVTKELPTGWVLVVRDLYQDFGQFDLTGLGFTPFRGQGLFDHVYLGKSPDDFKVLEKLRP